MGSKIALILKFSLIFFAIPVAFAFYEGYTELQYTDVDAFDEFYPSIDYFTNQSIVSGYSDGHFGSHENINRVEALKIILLASNVQIIQDIPATQDIIYKDLEQGAWYIPYVLTASNFGIVNGYLDNTFKPDKEVNLAEALKMIFYANDLRELARPDDDPANDVPMDSWYSDEVSYAIEQDVVWPDVENNVEPDKILRRGELLDLLYKFLLRDKEDSIIYTGVATYYGDSLEGNNTSSGEPYDSTKFTAAHRFLKFGTKITVVNIVNGKKIDVVINDRGPYSNNYDLDLSRVAFEFLSPLSSGIIDTYYYIVN